MLPFNFNARTYVRDRNKEQYEKDQKERKRRQLATSQQSIANMLVGSSLATNANAGQLQQIPAKH